MITELKTFIAVVRHGSFSAAGERIGLTQSAVSSQIKRLEESLGFELFDRTRRAAVLNIHGSQTLARAEEIVALYEKLGDPAAHEDAAGTLRIGAIASAQSALLPRALAAMRRKFPKLRLNIVPGVSMRLMDELDAGAVDAAVMIRPPFGLLPEITWQPLVSEPFVLLVPGSVRGRDWRKILASHPFLRYERTSFGGRLVTRFLRDENITVQEAIELDEITGLMNLVSQGLGVALVPMAEACLPMPSSVRIVSLGEQTFYREIGLLLRGKKQGPAMVHELAQCLREAAGGAKQPQRARTAGR